MRAKNSLTPLLYQETYRKFIYFRQQDRILNSSSPQLSIQQIFGVSVMLQTLRDNTSK